MAAGKCLQCDAELPLDAPKGLCPKCLLAAALTSADAAEAGDCPSSAALAPAENKQQKETQLSTAPSSPGATVRLEPNPQSALAPGTEAETHEMIGRYKVLQKLGEGGCGIVYMAEQQEPV